LPDAAAVETVSLADPETRILDASTAHRTQPGWVYGMPELTAGQRAQIRSAPREANPGCWPTGFLLAVRPLIDAGLISRAHPLSVHGQSGYSGGGKKMIESYHAHARVGASPDWAVRPYGLGLQHKHAAEMTHYALLEQAPLFCPSVGDYYQGMLVSVPLHLSSLAKRTTPGAVHALLSARYADEPFVRVMPLGGGDSLEAGCLNATALNDSNVLELFVFGHAEQLLLVARLDNLGKGAAGAAVQNLNLMLGRAEGTGLDEACAVSSAADASHQ
jgi:N-acetyl-gamma-glutamyl-phosphate reductase